MDELEPTASLISDRARLWSALLVAAFAFLFFVLFAARTPISTHGEAREGLVMKNMLAQHNYVLPLRNYSEIPSKPPFFHWLGAFSQRFLLLPAELASRFPSVFAAALALGAVFYSFARFVSGVRALAIVLVVATMFEWTRSAGQARVDMVYSALVTGAFCLLLDLLSRWERNELGGRTKVITLGVLLGCGVLTKGPVALAVPVFVVLVAFAVDFFRIRAVRPGAYELFTASCLAFGIGSVWYVAALIQGGSEFVRVQLLRENFARLFGLADYGYGHKGPFLSGIADFLLAFLPWSLFLPVILVSVWSDRQTFIRRLFTPWGFSLLWVVVYLLIFSFSASKRPVYFLPAVVPFAYLVVDVFSTNLDVSSRAVRLRGFFIEGFRFLLTALSAATVFTLAAILAKPQSWTTGIKVSPLVLDAIRLEAASSPLWFVVGLASVLLAFRSLRQSADGSYFRGVIASSFVLLLLAQLVGQVFVAGISFANSPQVFVAEMSLLVPADAKLFQYKQNFYPTLFYYSKPIPITLGKELEGGGQNYVIMRPRDVEEFRVHFPESRTILTSDNLVNEGRDQLVLVSLAPASEPPPIAPPANT